MHNFNFPRLLITLLDKETMQRTFPLSLETTRRCGAFPDLNGVSDKNRRTLIAFGEVIVTECNG